MWTAGGSHSLTHHPKGKGDTAGAVSHLAGTGWGGGGGCREAEVWLGSSCWLGNGRCGEGTKASLSRSGGKE